MKTIEIKTGIDNKQYKVCDDTFYDIKTKDKIIQILENARQNKTRIRLFYGENRKCWNDEFETIGIISRSCGNIKIPILIKNARSWGGTGILDHCIVKIDINYGKSRIVTLYQDKTIKFDFFVCEQLIDGNTPEYNAKVIYQDTGKVYANCKSYEQAARLASFMNGKRWAK